jgi:hypothetical protein
MDNAAAENKRSGKDEGYRLQRLAGLPLAFVSRNGTE